MTATAVAAPRPRALVIRGTPYPLLLPSLRDARLHLAAVIVSLQVLGQTACDFRLSIAQILISLGTCAVLEVALTFWRQRVLMWPASALLTGNGSRSSSACRAPSTATGGAYAAGGSSPRRPPSQDEYVGDILSSADHLLALINDILDLSKVEAGQFELEIAPFSLREALERGVVMVKERAVKNRVELSLSPDPEVQVVEGDERRVRQVLFNVLSNAVKFTPAGGRVNVSSARLDGEVRVSVADTGPGIAPQDLERIFEEFQQTEAGASQHEGTGLGLALSKRLIELHGGRLWVESEVGKGSTFTFALPVKGK